jgi:transcriptional regulator with XRE-family HTH domain
LNSTTLEKLRNMFPRRLARVRGERSQRQFAHQLGVFQQNVNRYENGTMPHANFLLTLATKENISLDWLLLGRGRMHYGPKR